MIIPRAVIRPPLRLASPFRLALPRPFRLAPPLRLALPRPFRLAPPLRPSPPASVWLILWDTMLRELLLLSGRGGGR